MIAPRIDVVRHLALYTSFHRADTNRALHGALVPVILFSMMCLQAYARIGTSSAEGCVFHMASLLSVLLVVVLATVDLTGALALTVFLLPASLLAGWLSTNAPVLILVPTAIAAQLMAWYGTVVIGHERAEPTLSLPEGEEDSNVYFRRGYFLARDLGCSTGRLDGLVQFCIAPLAVVQDALVWLGLRSGLARRIEDERALVVARIERGGAPLSIHADQPAPRPATFIKALRDRVDARLAKHGRTRFGEGRYLAKALFFLALYLGVYLSLLILPLGRLEALGVAVLFAVTQVLVAFNVPHDASHGSAFSNRRLNRIFARAFDLIGLSTYVWHIRHDLAHHVHTNEPGMDPDIDGGPLLRLSPSDPLRPVHRFQHLYAPFFYLLTGPLLTMLVDWRWLMDEEFTRKLGIRHPRGARLRLLLQKLFFFGYALVVPMFVLPFSPLEVVVGFLLANAFVGLFVALVLLPAHCMEHAIAPPALSDGERRDPDVIAKTQLAMTLDYAPKSWLANLLLGGFSTNGIHHLLPGLSHVHHRLVNDVLEETAEEYGVVYHRTTMLGALRSHFRFLARMGRQPAAQLSRGAADAC